jgi:hypothetical protein
MRTIKNEDSNVYTLDELEPDARERAIENVAEKLGGEWWESSDTDDISAVMRYTLANKLGTPGHGDWGVGDFPGIDGVELRSWDLDRGSYLGLKGTLTRENAPALPWSDGVIEVTLTEGRDYTSISVEFDDEMATPDIELIEGQMDEAVRDAMHEAMRDGRAEMEYKTGPECAREDIEANEREFYEDGTLYA